MFCFSRARELVFLHTKFKIRLQLKIEHLSQITHPSQLIQVYHTPLPSTFQFQHLISPTTTPKIAPHHLTTLYRRSYRRIPIISTKITPKFLNFKLPSYQDFTDCTNLFLILKQKCDKTFQTINSSKIIVSHLL